MPFQFTSDRYLQYTAHVHADETCTKETSMHPLCKVFKVGWWMGAYGHPTPKRSKGLSNNPWILKFDKGRLDRAKFRNTPAEHKTTKTYVDKSGRKRYAGLPGLKKSQTLAPELHISISGSVSYGLHSYTAPIYKHAYRPQMLLSFRASLLSRLYIFKPLRPCKLALKP